MAENNPTIASAKDVAAIAEMARRGATPQPLEAGTAYYLAGPDRRFTTEALCERPSSMRGSFAFLHMDDLLEYVNQRGAVGDGAQADVVRFWCDRESLMVAAVLDGHSDAGPGWHRHRAVWQMTETAHYKALLAINGKPMAQVDFAEWVEDHAHLMLAPTPADMKQMALQFQATQTANVRSVSNLQTGATQFTYDADAKSVGQVEVPHDVVFRLAAYVGFPDVDLTARLRWRINRDSGKPNFHLRLVGDIAMRDAHWQKAVDSVRAAFADRRVYIARVPGESEAVKV